MRLQRVSSLLTICRIAGVLSCALIASMSGAAPPKKADMGPTTTQASPVSGAELYKSQCASCHGSDAKGNGPAAEALRMRPTDLTQLAARNGGRFPAHKLELLLGGSDNLPVHGSRTMPIWGPGFKGMNRDDGQAAVRIRELVRYLESIQK